MTGHHEQPDEGRDPPGAPEIPDQPRGGASREGQGPPAATWAPVEAVPVFAISTLATFIAAGVIAVLVSSCSARFVLSTLAGEVAFFLSVLFWVRYVNRGSLAALGTTKRPWGDLISGAVAGGALILIGSGFLALVRTAAGVVLGRELPQPEQVVSCVTGSWLFVLAPVVVLAAPIGEEIFFRGFLYNALRRRFRVPLAAVISSVLFALVHVHPLLIASLFVVGVGLALIYERRQSLLASVAAHATFNLVGYVFIALSRR